MKYIFIVTWIVVNVIVKPPTTDEYGIKNNSALSLRIINTVASHKSKIFYTKKEAKLFIKNAPKKKNEYLDSYCKDFKIDSIKVGIPWQVTTSPFKEGIIIPKSYICLDNHLSREELERRAGIYLNKMDSLIKAMK